MGALSGMSGLSGLSGVMGGLDPDTILWRDAVMANSGTVSTSSISSFDNFFKGLKADALWPKIVDMGAFVGVDNLNAAMVKLKTAPSTPRILVNNNFVGPDYTATGASAGLLGNGINKHLNSNVPTNTLAAGNRHFGVYITDYGSVSTETIIGSNPGRTYANFTAIAKQSSGYTNLYLSGEPIYQGSIILGAANQHIIAISGSPTQIKGFSNGVLIDTDTIPAATLNADAIFIFAQSRGVSAADRSNSRLSMYHMGLNFTDTEVDLFSTRVNTLMTAFGANIY